jgi:hypothetical protein
MRSALIAAREELRDTLRGDSMAHAHLRGRVLMLAVCTLAIDIVATLVIWLCERHARGTQIHSVGGALFWTTTQLLTVSSSLANPISALGRIVDIVLQLWAITAVGALAGSFGAFFHHRSMARAAMGGGPPG